MINTVNFTTCDKFESARSSIAAIFLNTCRILVLKSPSTIFPVSGSIGICPDVKRRPLEIIPWLYEPIGFGA